MEAVGFRSTWTGLRNIAPREGTEIFFSVSVSTFIFTYIKKYSSPRGDGNAKTVIVSEVTLLIKKYSSPRGDGNPEIKYF